MLQAGVEVTRWPQIADASQTTLFSLHIVDHYIRVIESYRNITYRDKTMVASKQCALTASPSSSGGRPLFALLRCAIPNPQSGAPCNSTITIQLTCSESIMSNRTDAVKLYSRSPRLRKTIRSIGADRRAAPTNCDNQRAAYVMLSISHRKAYRVVSCNLRAIKVRSEWSDT